MNRQPQVAVLIILAALLIASCNRQEPQAARSENPKKQQIQEFWESFHRATSLRTSGRFEEAALAYERALKLDPRHEESLYYLGSCRMETGEQEQAVQIYRVLIDLNPRSSRGLSQLGLLLSTPAPGAVLNLEEARTVFERVAGLNQEESGSFLRLGMLSLRQHDNKAAWKHFQTAAGFKSPEGLFFSGYMRYQEGKYREAASLFQKVLEMNRNEKRLSGRGVFSEGDIASSGGSLSNVEKTGVKALIFLNWTARKLGGYPDSVPEDFRIHQRGDGIAVQTERLPGSGRGIWCDINNDRAPDLVLVNAGETRVFLNNHGKLNKSLALPGGFDAACGDADADGRQDVYVINSGYMGAGQNVLYRNTGEGILRDVTHLAGLQGVRATAAAEFADVDGDSDQDLIEAGNAPAPLRIYRNRGGVFQLQPVAFSGNAVSVSIADYNGDGAPDLFVLRWRRPALLLQNDGKGNFTDVTSATRLESAGGNSYSAVFLDYNHDPWPDLFVSRHAPYESSLSCLLQPALQRNQEAPQLFVNMAGKSFRDASEAAGLHQAYGTMKAIASDIDRDGWADIVLASGGLDPWRLEPSTVLHNRHGERFDLWGRFPSGPPVSPGSCAVADIDSDNTPEILISDPS